VGVWHHEDVFQDGLKTNLVRTRNGEGLLVDGLIDEFVDDTLRDALWLSHKLFLKEDLLPIHCITSFFGVDFLITTLILTIVRFRSLASRRTFSILQLKVICLHGVDGMLIVDELTG
jgi:hypothetical protein